jgi:hypothetical protein
MTEKKNCFVICPIGEEGSADREHSDLVLKHIITPVLDSLGFEATRADEITSPGIITNQIIDLLIEAPLVIADLTNENPNVYYELAVRHAIGKPCIHIIKMGQPIPFDNSGVRATTYDFRVDHADRAREALKSQIQSITQGEHQPDNPITTAKRYNQLKKKITSSEDVSVNDVLIEMANTLTNSMNEMRKDINEVRRDINEVRGTYPRENREILPLSDPSENLINNLVESKHSFRTKSTFTMWRHLKALQQELNKMRSREASVDEITSKIQEIEDLERQLMDSLR